MYVYLLVIFVIFLIILVLVLVNNNKTTLLYSIYHYLHSLNKIHVWINQIIWLNQLNYQQVNSSFKVQNKSKHLCIVTNVSFYAVWCQKTNVMCNFMLMYNFVNLKGMLNRP